MRTWQRWWVLAAFSLGFAVPAKADGVLLYGIVDTGIEYLTNTTKTHGDTLAMPSVSASVPSRWGLKGSESLGNGLDAVFDLESGFAVSTGASQQGGRLFGRDAYVGLRSDRYGTLTLGRQPTMLTDSLHYADVIGPSIFGLADFDSYVTNARADNSVRYSLKIPHFEFGTTYSFGRDSASGGSAANCAGPVPGNFLACRDISLMAGVEFGPGGVSFAYDEQRGNAGATDGITTPQQKHTRTSTNGYVVVGPLKFGGGWYGQKIEAARGQTINIYYLGGIWNLTPSIDFAGQIDRQIVERSSNSTLYIARAEYNLSAVTAAYVMYAYMNNSANAVVPLAAATVGPGLNSQGVMLGIRHMF